MKKITLLLCAFVFICASCSFNQGDNKPLKVAIERALSTLNYQKSAATSDMEQMSQMMEGLLTFDTKGEVVAAGAKSWNISEDGLRYQFTLREDAKWQDGSPVVAQDYYFAWLQIVAHKTSPFAYTLFPIKNAEKIYQGEVPETEFGVKVISDYVLEITLEQPYLSFIYSLATPTMYPLKQSFYERVGADNFGTSEQTILTNGAYNIQRYEAASRLFLTKAETYWDKANVSIPEVEVYVVPEEAARRALFDKGDLDIMPVGADSIELYRKKNTKMVTEKTSKINYLYLSGNTLQENELLKNTDFRRAIGFAIDRHVLTDNILKDGSTPLTRFVPCEFAFVESVDYCTLTADNSTYTFDAQRAREHFAQAQQALPGQDMALEITYQEAENNVHVLENLKFQLEKTLPGLRVNLRGVPVQGYSTTLRKDGVASAMQTWSGSFPNPEVYLQILETGSSFNYAKYQNDDFAAKYQQAMRTIDKKEQFSLYGEAENIAMDAFMVLPLYQKGTTYVLSNRVDALHYKMTIPNVYYKNVVLN